MADIIMEYIQNAPYYIRVDGKCYQRYGNSATSGEGHPWTSDILAFEEQDRCWNCGYGAEACTSEVYAALPIVTVDLSGLGNGGIGTGMTGCTYPDDADFTYSTGTISISKRTDRCGYYYQSSAASRIHWGGKRIHEIEINYSNVDRRWDLHIKGYRDGSGRTMWRGICEQATAPKGIYRRTEGCCLVTSMVVS